MNGNEIMIFRDGVLIAGTKSNEVSTSCETIGVSSPMAATTEDAGWKQHLTGRKEWSVTTSFLIMTESGVDELLNVGTSYTLRFGPRSSGGITGQATLTAAKISASRGSLIQGSFTFTGNGVLKKIPYNENS